MVTVSIHRSRRQGHIDEKGLAALRRLLPHLRQAYDVMRRLKEAHGRANALGMVLHWLSDGVILVSADGSVLDVNDAARIILSWRMEFGSIRRRLEFDATSVRAEFEAALGQVTWRPDGLSANPPADIAVRRAAPPSYLLSIRPIARGSKTTPDQPEYGLHASPPDQRQDRLQAHARTDPQA
jgi:PAS domain-containing protein